MKETIEKKNKTFNLTMYKMTKVWYNSTLIGEIYANSR